MLKPDQIQNKAAPSPVDAKGSKPTVIRCPKCGEKIGERWHGKVFHVTKCQCEVGGR